MITEPNEVYHANSAISHSKLELFRRRPISYYRRFISKTVERPEATEAFRIGSAAHCAVLEPTTLLDRYTLRPYGIDRRTKEGKIAFAEFEAANSGKTIMTAEEFAWVHEMTAAVNHHPLASQLLVILGQAALVRHLRRQPARTLVLPEQWPPPTGSRPLTIDAKKLATNSLTVRCGAERTRVWLSPELVDFTQPLTVTINGQKSHKGPIEADPRVLLEDLRLRADRQHPFWAVIESAPDRGK